MDDAHTCAGMREVEAKLDSKGAYLVRSVNGKSLALATARKDGTKKFAPYAVPSFCPFCGVEMA